MSPFRKKAKPADDAVAAQVEATATEPEDAEPEDLGPSPSDGPYDLAEAPDRRDRLDIGGLQLAPVAQGIEVKLQLDDQQRVTAVLLELPGASVQVMPFAAPKSRSLWDDVRAEMVESAVADGMPAEEVEGSFGTELRLTPTGAEPMRIAGVDGPRWFLRAAFNGAGVNPGPITDVLETAVRSMVVVRGTHAMAPREMLPMHLPTELGGGPVSPVTEEERPPLVVPRRGPEITQIG